MDDHLAPYPLGLFAGSLSGCGLGGMGSAYPACAFAAGGPAIAMGDYMNAFGHVGTRVWFKAPIRRPDMASHLNGDVNTNMYMFVTYTNVCDLDNGTTLMQTSVMRDKEIYQLLGQQIAARRRGLKMTQSKLAGKVGISRASIANIEGGRQNVLLHHLYRFAEALNMSEVAELLPVTVKPSRANDEFLGVSFSDENISEKTKALMSNLVSRALSQRKVKP